MQARPALCGLVDVGDPQRRVVERAGSRSGGRGVAPLRTAASASSSGIASATCRVWALTSGGAPTSSRSRSSSTIVIAEPADPLDLDLDHVARLDRPRVRRRAGQQHVAGLERDQPRDVGDLVGEREDQVGAGVALLDLLAVDEGADGEVVGIELGGVDQAGTERAEPVLALDPQHRAAVDVAEVVDAEVVGDGVAGDVVERLGSATPVARLPITSAISPS